MKLAWRYIGILAFWVSWPALYFWLRRSVRVRTVVSCKGKILLVQNWYNSGQWQLPGGGIRPAESPAITAQRELAEETSIELSEADFSIVGEPFWVRERGLLFRVQVLQANVADEGYRVRKREITAGKWAEPTAEQANLSQSTIQALTLVENLP